MMVGLAGLRAVGIGALLVLLWNPGRAHPVAETPPLVLLDASLSMGGYGGRWREAVESARALARGGPIWRFGTTLQPFDSLPPTEGATTLAPGLVAAASRGGPVVVVTDGAIDDRDAIAPDLLSAPRVVLLPRRMFRDYFVRAVAGPHWVGAADTLRLEVTCGTAGPRGSASRSAILVARLGERALLNQRIVLPDSGSIAVPIALPAAGLPAGWSALEIRLEGVRDSEPLDDGHLFVVNVRAAPAFVVVAAPADWDARFLARTLASVAGAPVRLFALLGGDASAGRWIDGATLAATNAEAVRSALRTAALVVVAGRPSLRPLSAPAVLRLVPRRRVRSGIGTSRRAPSSPLSGALAGVAWDSLPPLIAVTPADSGTAALTARVARRGPPRPVVLLSDGAGGRTAVIAGAGLYRWAFRGCRTEDAYRTLVAALVDWLLGGRAPETASAVPVTLEVSNGLPLVWRWNAAGAPADVPIRVCHGPTASVRDTLQFGPTGGRAYAWRPAPLCPDSPADGSAVWASTLPPRNGRAEATLRAPAGAGRERTDDRAGLRGTGGGSSGSPSRCSRPSGRGAAGSGCPDGVSVATSDAGARAPGRRGR